MLVGFNSLVRFVVDVFFEPFVCLCVQQTIVVKNRRYERALLQKPGMMI